MRERSAALNGQDPAYLEDLEVVGECGNVRVIATMTKTVQLFSEISEPN
jgi:hypothetical protein